ncbi:hypothetical protein ES708_32753 [subsurface metagenome]
MKKQTMETLDKVNLLWFFKQFSVGNLVRGVYWTARTLKIVGKKVEKCVASSTDKIKKSIEEVKKEEQKQSGKKGRKTSSRKKGIEVIETDETDKTDETDEEGD